MGSGYRPSGFVWILVAFLIAVLFLTGGLIFLCAAVDRPGRLPIALALLVVGGALAAWAGVRWRKARQLSPDVLERRITDLAATHGAEVTLALAVSALDVPDDLARATLAHLEAEGLCHQDRREGKTIYIFPGLQESKVVRRCTYCGNEYSVREVLHQCPNCGGKVEIVRT
jgi:hypothetical protein